jgi:acyl-CoA thioesterase-1
VRRPLLPFAVAIALTLGRLAPAAAESCLAPPELVELGAPLPRTADRLRHEEPLSIVAIGSSSTAGYGVAAPANSYPNRLAVELQSLLPETPLRVYNKGVNGEEAADMLRRFERDVIALQPDLVIWQVGTNGVMHDEDPATIDATVRAGVERLKRAGIDVILMDVQFAPRVLGRPGLARVTADLARTAKEEEVGRFRRFDVMRHWLETRQLDFKRMVQEDGLHLSDQGDVCIARLLAGAIVDEARLPAAATRTTSAR